MKSIIESFIAVAGKYFGKEVNPSECNFVQYKKHHHHDGY